MFIEIRVRWFAHRSDAFAIHQRLHAPAKTSCPWGSKVPPQKVFGPSWHPPQSHLLRMPDWIPNGCGVLRRPVEAAIRVRTEETVPELRDLRVGGRPKHQRASLNPIRVSSHMVTVKGASMVKAILKDYQLVQLRRYHLFNVFNKTCGDIKWFNCETFAILEIAKGSLVPRTQRLLQRHPATKKSNGSDLIGFGVSLVAKLHNSRIAPGNLTEVAKRAKRCYSTRGSGATWRAKRGGDGAWHWHCGTATSVQ